VSYLLYSVSGLRYVVQVESIIYGAYAIMFGLCVRLLYVNRKKGVNTKPLLVTAIMMFTLSTAHMIVQLIRAITAFVYYNDVLNGADRFYAQFWLPSSVLKLAIYATNNIVADGLLIYRCYIVWGYQWKVAIVPILMLIGSEPVSGYRSVYNFSQAQSTITPDITAWGDAMFVLSLLTTLLVSSLIAYRIYWIGRRLNAMLGPGQSRKHRYTIAIVLESGALYSAPLVLLLVLFSFDSVYAYIVYDALAQIMGLAPTIIIVRVGLGISTQGVAATPKFDRLSTPLRSVSVDPNDTDSDDS